MKMRSKPKWSLKIGGGKYLETREGEWTLKGVVPPVFRLRKITRLGWGSRAVGKKVSERKNKRF